MKAIEDCALYRLDRGTFNHIVKDAAQRKREKYEDFLKTVTILQSMEEYGRSKLVNAFKDLEFAKDEFLIREGEKGSTLYIIAEGTAIATKTLEAGKAPVEVRRYQKGDYFGEMALLKNEPRAANVITQTDLKVVSLDRHSFKRLIGPLENLLKRNMDQYEKVTKKL